MKRSFLLTMLAAGTLSAIAQRPTTPTPSTPRPGAPAGATVQAPAGMPGGAGMMNSKPGPKAFKEVITDKAISQKGLFTVHKVDDKFYFEIADSMLNREFMAITRFSKVAGGGGTYGGELANQVTLSFEKGPSNNVFLRVITLISVADSTNDIYKAVRNSNVNPIAAAFDIKALSKDSSGVVIDVTEFFKGDNQVVSINPFNKRRFNITVLAPDRSYISSIKAFPINNEIRTVKTFNASAGGGFGVPGVPSAPSLPAAQEAGAITVEMNTSLILLPKTPMKKRFFDPRVGYFADDFTVFGDDQQKVEREVFAVRWRLEPKPEDMEKYKRGELVEPVKPIVYYIDPATPKKWRKYLIMGVNDWQKAFEKAGFKNAIIAKELPEGDTTISPEDARYSFIRYFASDIENAYGPNVHDPRSGEILESHIGWYHNVMKLLHDWYMIQAAAVDPKARSMKFDDELMGQLIRFVSSHEVGHTLGLRHNMGSSSRTPVEKLRDKAWVEANGHTASIMDYARFNYVAQPEDNISQAGLFPRIGDYDLWAIEWGYRYSFTKTDEEEKAESNKTIIERIGKNPRLWFGTETNPFDPRSQTEDLSDNSMKAGEYGIKNLKRILTNLPEWTKEAGDRYDNLEEMYGQLVGQFSRYMGHVLKHVGGIYETPKSIEEKGDVYEPNPKNNQKEALAFLNRNLFETPTWLLDRNVLNKFSNPISNESVSNVQASVLNSLLSGARMSRMLASANRFGASNVYTADEMLDDARKGIWSELVSKKPIDPYRRNLQKIYVEALISALAPPTSQNLGGGITISFGTNLRNTDAASIVKAHLQALRAQINAAIPTTTDKLSKYHLQDVSERIKQALDPK
jgi:ribosomal protein S18 acetylase RimI-like enzyme